MGGQAAGLRRVVLAASAPLVLPAVSHAQAEDHRDAVAELRRAQADAIAALDAAVPTLIVTAGAPSGVHDHARYDLRPLGVPDVTGAAPHAGELLADVTGAAQLPLLVGEPLGVDAAVLTAALDGGHRVVAVEVPRAASGDALVAMGASLARTLARQGRAFQVLAAGDLSAGLGTDSPRYRISDAREVQARTVTAVRRGDAEGVADVGSEAAAAAVRSWAAVCVAVGAAATVPGASAEVDVVEVRGVGHLVGVLA